MTSSPSYPSGATGTATDPLGIESILDELRVIAGEQAEPAGGAAPHLVKNANKGGSSTSPKPASDAESRGKEAPKVNPENRTQRWVARGVLWDMSQLERVRKCGRVAVTLSGDVEVRKSHGVVGFAGLSTCGSVWACPVCSAKIQATRREEISTVVRGAAPLGTLAFGTVTLRHKKGQSLAKLWDALSYCFQRVRQDKGVRKLRDQMGFYGYVRAVEVTHGGNGWHPHIHSLNFFDREVSQAELVTLADAEFRAWKAAALKVGLGAPLRARYDLKMVENADEAFGDYLTKSVYESSSGTTARAVGFEMSGSMTKSGRSKGSRTPWQILQDFEATGDLDDLDLWHEYEKASKGRRSLTWSRGLKAMFEVDEVEDEEIADEEFEADEEKEVLFRITDWSPVARNAWLGGQLLAEVESGGREAGLRFCAEHGIPTAEGPGYRDDDDDEDNAHIMRDFTTV